MSGPRPRWQAGPDAVPAAERCRRIVGMRRILGLLALPLALAGCAETAVPPKPRPVTAADADASQGGRTELVAFDTTPFPYHGLNPGNGRPFMDVDLGGRLGHSSGRNGVLWEDQTYADKRVLLSIPRGFDPRRPAALVVFLHGNGATLARDVLGRQGVPRQLAASGLNAVLVAPQFAIDARDSSAGRFWEPGVFAAFLREAAARLATLGGDAEARFAAMPVVLVGYSGGYLPTAAALRYGEAGDRVAAVVLLDALYGEADTFSSWIERRRGIFVSLYGASSRPGNDALRRRLVDDRIPVDDALPARLEPGRVVLVGADDVVAHGDMVTAALGGDPLARILGRIDPTDLAVGGAAVAAAR